MHIYLQFAKALWLTTEKLFEIEEQEIKPMGRYSKAFFVQVRCNGNENI